eukprot:COSAG04_NODE_686_length_11156_cov_44.791806_1_plen_65_part_00
MRCCCCLPVLCRPLSGRGVAGHNDHSTDGALDMEAMKWIFYLDAVGPDTGVRTPPPHSLWAECR